MFDEIILSYHNQECPNYWFTALLNYYVKRNNVRKVEEILSHTHWRNDANYIQLSHSIYDCIFYKKPQFKLFNLLLSHQNHKEYPDLKISVQDTRRFFIQDLIKSCISMDKESFAERLVIKEDCPKLVLYTMTQSIKHNKNDLSIKLLNKYFSNTIRESFIENSIKYKSTKLIEYYHSKYNALHVFSIYHYEKYPEEPQQHYIPTFRRKAQLTKFNIKDIESNIREFLTKEGFYTFMFTLIKQKDIKSFDKWMNQYKNGLLKFDKIDFASHIDGSMNSFRAIDLIKINELNNLAEINSFNKNNFKERLSQIIQKGLIKKKEGYCLEIQKKLNMESLIFDTDMSEFYFANYGNIMKIDSTLKNLSLSQKVRLCSVNENNPLIFEILKDYSWEDIEKYVYKEEMPIFLQHHMNLHLSQRIKVKKVKI